LALEFWKYGNRRKAEANYVSGRRIECHWTKRHMTDNPRVFNGDQGQLEVSREPQRINETSLAWRRKSRAVYVRDCDPIARLFDSESDAHFAILAPNY